MKYFLSLAFLTFLIISLIGNVSANCGFGDHLGCGIDGTIVEGRVYYEDTGEYAGNAHVTVTCYHNGKTYTQSTETIKKGTFKGGYLVLFPQSKCVYGDEVIVSAVKDGMAGSEEGEVKNTIFNGFFINVDLAIVNVPLVPEFGVVVGMLTIFGAMGIFLFVRKN